MVSCPNSEHGTRSRANDFFRRAPQQCVSKPAVAMGSHHNETRVNLLGQAIDLDPRHTLTNHAFDGREPVDLRPVDDRVEGLPPCSRGALVQLWDGVDAKGHRGKAQLVSVNHSNRGVQSRCEV